MKELKGTSKIVYAEVDSSWWHWDINTAILCNIDFLDGSLVTLQKAQVSIKYYFHVNHFHSCYVVEYHALLN